MAAWKLKRIKNMKEKSRDLENKIRSNTHHIKFPGVNKENRGQELFEENRIKEFSRTKENNESTNTRNTMYAK